MGNKNSGFDEKEKNSERRIFFAIPKELIDERLENSYQYPQDNIEKCSIAHLIQKKVVELKIGSLGKSGEVIYQKEIDIRKFTKSKTEIVRFLQFHSKENMLCFYSRKSAKPGYSIKTMDLTSGNIEFDEHVKFKVENLRSYRGVILLEDDIHLAFITHYSKEESDWGKLCFELYNMQSKEIVGNSLCSKKPIIGLGNIRDIILLKNGNLFVNGVEGYYSASWSVLVELTKTGEVIKMLSYNHDKEVLSEAVENHPGYRSGTVSSLSISEAGENEVLVGEKYMIRLLGISDPKKFVNLKRIPMGCGYIHVNRRTGFVNFVGEDIVSTTGYVGDDNTIPNTIEKSEVYHRFYCFQDLDKMFSSLGEDNYEKEKKDQLLVAIASFGNKHDNSFSFNVLTNGSFLVNHNGAVFLLEGRNKENMFGSLLHVGFGDFIEINRIQK